MILINKVEKTDEAIKNGQFMRPKHNKDKQKIRHNTEN